MKRLLSGINPWLPVLAFTTFFHVTRGSVGDSIIFGLGSLLLIADWKKLIPWHMPERPKVSGWVIGVVIAISCSVLLFTERDGWQDRVLLLTLAPIALVMVYYRDHGPKPGATKQMARTKWIWMTLALVMAVSELFAYIFATVYKDDTTYPTISILVNPVLESPWGRSTFLTLWMLIGVGLLQIRKKGGGPSDSNP
ncbi:hypothetical protein [Rhodoluna lacicola]|uniref:hypothetical protein n=1 Tax=Rhodoluna lacicola TaxID=529884 RepID=UPI002231965E|nr:hypothetical protein [Rhodoluna lacicola]BDS50671.1 hypothetical protein RKACHI23_09330 [Rhodoluna lacicola]